MVKLMKIVDMMELTILIKEKTLSKFISMIAKVLLEFLLEIERKAGLILRFEDLKCL